MKQIPLTGKYGRGKFALVDDEDYEMLASRPWWLDAKGYANSNGSLMHRIILGIDGAGRRIVGDHINFNKLDNRRENLRAVTQPQNARHRQTLRSKDATG